MCRLDKISIYCSILSLFLFINCASSNVPSNLEIELGSTRSAPAPQSSEEKADKEEDVYVIVKDLPKLKGGEKGLKQRIQNPEKGIEGTSSITFVIDEFGKTSQFSITKALGSGYDEAVIEALKKSEFKPGIEMDGTPVRFQFTISVTFK